MSGSRKYRSPEEQARRVKIRELLQESNGTLPEGVCCMPSADVALHTDRSH
jgi:hypothetical protein